MILLTIAGNSLEENRMKIDKAELLTALEVVKPGLANKEIIEQSTSFAFMGDRVVTYNDEISISHPVKGLNITGAIRAQEFYQLLNKSKKAEIELVVTDNEIQISAGKERAGITLAQEIKLPLDEFTLPDKWHSVDPELLTAIKFCAFSCSKDMSKPVLTCVHVRKDGIIEGCDNSRITRYKIKPLAVKTLLIPVSSAMHLTNLNITEIAEGAGWVHLKTTEGTVFSCRVFADSYPDTNKFFDVEGIEMKLPKNLKDILDKAGIFAKRDFSSDQLTTITLADNKMKLRTESDAGWFEAEANIRYTHEQASFSVNPAFLKEICEKTQACILGDRVLKFEGDNWQHIVALLVRTR